MSGEQGASSAHEEDNEVQGAHIENEQWCTPQGCDSQAVKKQEAHACATMNEAQAGCNENGQCNAQGLCVSQAAMRS